MRMRGKVIAILALLIASVLLAQHFIASRVVMPEFLALEHQKGTRDTNRVEIALAMKLDQMEGNVRDYAQWDPMYAFLKDRNPELPLGTLTPRAFKNLQLNCIYIFDETGHKVWGETRDCATTLPMDIPGLPEAEFSDLGKRFRNSSLPEPISGLLACGDRVMLVAFSPVLTSKGEGPARGHAVFGRLLLPRELAYLSEQVQVKFSLCNRLPALNAPEKDDAPQAKGIIFDNIDEQRLDVYSPLVDLNGKRIGWIATHIPRQISAQGRQALRGSLYIIGIAGLLILAAAYWSFGHFVVKPIEKLTRHVLWIRQSGDLTNRLNVRRTDEVGILASEFDQLLSTLANDRASRRRYEQRLRTLLQEQNDRRGTGAPPPTNVPFSAPPLGEPAETFGVPTDYPLP
jgi:two-component system, NtrC family, sensor kinase